MPPEESYGELPSGGMKKEQLIFICCEKIKERERERFESFSLILICSHVKCT